MTWREPIPFRLQPLDRSTGAESAATALGAGGSRAARGFRRRFHLARRPLGGAGLAACGALLLLAPVWGQTRKKTPPPQPLDEFVQATRGRMLPEPLSPGSLFTPGSRFSNLARDLRASQLGDIVTIQVNDRASAVTRGSTTAERTASASASVRALAGPRNSPGLNDLTRLSSDFSLEGSGSTARNNSLTATITAVVVEVLPSGDLVLEGTKEVQANSERQRITVRGVARWNDIGPNNIIRSDRLGQVEIRINGKGVVSDAIRRPNFLYRLLLGLLPF